MCENLNYYKGFIMQKVVIYSKETCPYCVMAKNLLKQKGVEFFEEIRIDLDEKKRDEMIKITGRMTVPQIFIGDTHVGGFDDLSALNRGGKLDDLLNK
jgi:glutaredoxin 3